MIIEVSTPTLIAEGTTLRGDLSFQSRADIFGVVEGEVHQNCLEALRIGKTGWIRGSVIAEGPVIVEGRVDGDVTSQTRVRLAPTAMVRGRLKTPSLQVVAGAILDAELAMEEKHQIDLRAA